MKTILVFITFLFSIPSKAAVCDTVGFKVNVPKISKVDDKAVSIKITIDTIKNKPDLLIAIDGVLVTGKDFSKINVEQIETIDFLKENTGQIISCHPFLPVCIIATKKDRLQKIIIKNEDGEAVPGTSLSITLDDKVDILVL